MFELGDLIYCPGSDEIGLGWSEDWGIIFKIDDETSATTFHVHWLNEAPTIESEDWLYNNCDWAASAGKG